MNPCSEEEYYYKLDNIVLSSCQCLRHVFRNRWKSETGEDWVDDQVHLLKFVEGIGQNAYKKAPSFQKALMKTQLVEEWDMSMITIVLQNFGSEKKYNGENTALLKLKTMRNNLAHNGNKKVTKMEFHKNVDIFRNSLKSLGVGEKETEKLVERAGVTSSLKALNYMMGLHKKADQFFIDGDVDKAIEKYSEAILVPSLLPVNLGTAYEKRAEFYLTLVKDSLADQDKINIALLDAIKALELNDSSWMAHYLAAKSYRFKNNLSQALKHYQKALAISPVQKHVKADYDGCKVVAGVQSREDHLNPRLMPMNLTERVAHLEKETGIKLDEKSFLRAQAVGGKLVKGQDHVFRGHQYFAGWGVPQDFTQAAKYYAKAANLKNAEGMYNLAMCYNAGNGVKQDIQEALRLYRETAEMDPKTEGEMTPLKCNAGVSGAQHSLGLMYEQGIGVEQDFRQAAMWYKRGMENGVGNSANNLAIMYSNGEGLPQDEKMAEMCWKQAVNLNDVNAPASLLSYYIDQLEPDKARNMVRVGREMGNAGLLQLSDVEMNQIIEAIKSERRRIEPNLKEFEKSHQLNAKGLTFKQRLLRQSRILAPGMDKLVKCARQAATNHKGEAASWGGMTQTFSEETISIIFEKAKQGSVTASRIIETVKRSLKLEDLLSGYTDDAREDLQWEILDLLYQCKQLEFHLVPHFVSSSGKLKSIVAKLFEKECEAKGEKDMKVRLCYAAYNLEASWRSEDMYVVELLKTGLQRYPKHRQYYYDLTALMGNKGKFREGRRYSEEGLKLFPEDVDLLYFRAVCIRNETLSSKLLERVEAFEKFLSVAPNDHRKVPEAYYQLSCFYLPQNQNREENVSEVERYFGLGQQAEKWQLPCYLPYGQSESKCLAETFVKMTNPDPEQLIKPVASAESELLLEKGILERKGYLKCPSRKAIILLHREHLKRTYEETVKLGKKISPTTAAPKLKQTMAKRLSMVKPITLQDMNPTEDQIYENKSLDLTVMDDLTAQFSSIHLIAEDENGDMVRLYIYNVGRDNQTLDKYRPGCRLAVVNPYMRIGAQDITHGIRNDEPNCLIFLEKVENMCRFCGEGNAMHKCANCKRPYCSRECQKLDWKELNHKLIRSLEIN